jgi:hypothetical protein
LDETKRADYWRKRAVEARLTAERSTDAGVRRNLQRMALTYDRLAQAREEAAGRRPALRLVHSVHAGRRS